MSTQPDSSARDAPLVAIPSQTIGPFFHFGMTAAGSLGVLAGPGAKGTPMRIELRVLDGHGEPVPDAMVEIWQADADGVYVDRPQGQERPSFVSSGRLPSDETGVCTFETIRPGRVPDGEGGWQAAHINVCLFARGLLRQLHTRVYFTGDAALGEDAALALVPAERRHTLLAHPSEADRDVWRFTLRLQGDEETVFFDL